MDTWKPIAGYEGLYEVSDSGRVRSLDRYIKTDIRHVTKRLQKGRILIQHRKRNGYYTVDLSKDGKVKTHTVHSLVADAFLPPDEARKCINHIDGDKTNNNVCNLERVTYSENRLHAFNTGLATIPWIKRVFCSDIPRAFTDADDAADWVMAQGKGTTKTTVANNIRRCCKGRTPKAYGFSWKYIESSTTIPKGSTRKRGEMGNPSTEGEDIV